MPLLRRVGTIGVVPRRRQAARMVRLSYPLSASSTSKRRRGRPRRPAIGDRRDTVE